MAYESSVYEAESGQWSWVITEDGEDVVRGGGYGSEEAAQADMLEERGALEAAKEQTPRTSSEVYDSVVASVLSPADEAKFKKWEADLRASADYTKALELLPQMAEARANLRQLEKQYEALGDARHIAAKDQDLQNHEAEKGS
jgi:hypothetical protein